MNITVSSKGRWIFSTCRKRLVTNFHPPTKELRTAQKRPIPQGSTTIHRQRHRESQLLERPSSQCTWDAKFVGPDSRDLDKIRRPPKEPGGNHADEAHIMIPAPTFKYI